MLLCVKILINQIQNKLILHKKVYTFLLFGLILMATILEVAKILYSLI